MGRDVKRMGREGCYNIDMTIRYRREQHIHEGHFRGPGSTWIVTLTFMHGLSTLWLKHEVVQ